MITLYSYPELFGVADNNGYGLKVFAFLRLTGVPFAHEHLFDASAAPRGQLPYIVDDGETIGDSDTILAHLIRKYRLRIDDGLTAAQRDTSHLITRMLDDLYWVMSYSRWKDERFWPAFRDALLREHPTLTEPGCARHRNSILSATTTRASDAMTRPPPTRADSRICRCWQPRSPLRLPAWARAYQHRRRHLRVHRQHPLLRDRYPAATVRHVAPQSRPALHCHSRRHRFNITKWCPAKRGKSQT